MLQRIILFVLLISGGLGLQAQEGEIARTDQYIAYVQEVTSDGSNLYELSMITDDLNYQVTFYFEVIDDEKQLISLQYSDTQRRVQAYYRDGECVYISSDEKTSTSIAYIESKHDIIQLKIWNKKENTTQSAYHPTNEGAVKVHSLLSEMDIFVEVFAQLALSSD